MNRDVHNMKSPSLFLTLILLLALPTSAAEIALKARVVPLCTVVRLGEVADIKATDAQEVERLASVSLMPAPATGKARYLRQRDVQDLLAAQGEDVSQLNFRGATMVQVESNVSGVQPAASTSGEPLSRFRAAWNGQPMPEETLATKAPSQSAMPPLSAARAAELHTELEQLFVKYLEHVSGRKANWRMSFEVPTAKLNLLASATSVLTCMGGNTPWTGRQRFVVTFDTADGLGRIPLHVDVASSQPAVVAVQPIERGRIVTAADIEIREFENLPAATVKRAPVLSVETIIGMEAARTIQTGEMLMTDDVAPQMLVKRGEQIAVYARGGGIQVRTLAKAKQDGARGQLIVVESLGTKKPFQAVVVGEREAVVLAGDSQPSPAAVAERPFRKQ
jgi:flagella basal body P-ring formation protein FlgA